MNRFKEFTKNHCVLLRGCALFSKDQYIPKAYLSMQGGIITDIGASLDFNDDLLSYDIVIDFPESWKMLPGFVDIHIHGLMGVDVMDGTFSALDVMACELPKEGVTSYVATTITEDVETIERALHNVVQYKQSHDQQTGKADLLGIHMEGPFISREKSASHRTEYILKPDVLLFQRWQNLAKGLIKIVTLAPEEDSDYHLIKYLKKTKVVASLGHSVCSYHDTLSSIDAGIQNITHLFNAMPGLHHRNPGPIGAVLNDHSTYVEMICDGIHVHPAVIRLALKLVGKDRLVLVSDAMSGKGLPDGEYKLGKQVAIVKNGIAKLKNGTLAGSTLKMTEAVKNILDFTKIQLDELVCITSYNPAKSIGVLPQKGILSVNSDADIVVVNEQNHLCATICRGTLAYKS